MSDHANDQLTAAEYRELTGQQGPQDEAGNPETAPKESALAIDPGTETGAAWTNGKHLRLATVDFWALLEELEHGADTDWPINVTPARTAIILEAPHLRPVTHARNLKGQNWRAAAKIAQNAGGVQREAELLAEGIERLGYQLTQTAPIQEKKWPAGYAERVAKGLGLEWEGPNNEHTRDAFRLLLHHNVV